MAKKGEPKKDGTGDGARKNEGRGGCADTKKVGQGRNSRLQREAIEEIKKKLEE